jgi:hypothetical protein
MNLFKNTFYALLVLWLSGCGANGLDFNPNDLSKVVIGNTATTPADEPPLVPNDSGVLVRSAIPGVPVVVPDPGPPITFSGIE